MKMDSNSSYIPGLTIDQLNQIIREEGLDDSMLDCSLSCYGSINFSYSSTPGLFHVVVNGEREPLADYPRLSEEEACNIVLNLLR